MEGEAKAEETIAKNELEDLRTEKPALINDISELRSARAEADPRVQNAEELAEPKRSSRNASKWLTGRMETKAKNELEDLRRENPALINHISELQSGRVEADRRVKNAEELAEPERSSQNASRRLTEKVERLKKHLEDVKEWTKSESKQYASEKENQLAELT